MTQKALAKQLIGLTLYKHLPWTIDGAYVNEGFMLKRAATRLEDKLVTIDYQHDRIAVNGHKQRVPKKLATDLKHIVKLKTAKIIKKYVSRHRIG
jgi:hypothetical protein